MWVDFSFCDSILEIVYYSDLKGVWHLQWNCQALGELIVINDFPHQLLLGWGWGVGMYAIHTFSTMHHSLSKQWQRTGTSNIVLLSSFTMTVFHMGPESLQKEALSRFYRWREPWAIHHASSANDRLMHKSYHNWREAAGMKRSESTVNGWDLKDCKLWLKSSIRTSRIYHATGKRGAVREMCTGIFLHQPCLLQDQQS